MTSRSLIGESPKAHEESVVGFPLGGTVAKNAVPEWFQQDFPDFLPSTPSMQNRSFPYSLANPFHHGATITHPRLRSRATTSYNAVDGAINGLVKFRIQFKHDKAPSWQSRMNWTSDENRQSTPQPSPFLNPAPNLPPDFGRGIKLDATDAKLLKFCKGLQWDVWESNH